MISILLRYHSERSEEFQFFWSNNRNNLRCFPVFVPLSRDYGGAGALLNTTGGKTIAPRSSELVSGRFGKTFGPKKRS